MHTCTCIHIYIYTYIQIYKYTFMHIHIHIYIHIDTPTYGCEKSLRKITNELAGVSLICRAFKLLYTI